MRTVGLESLEQFLPQKYIASAVPSAMLGSRLNFQLVYYHPRPSARFAGCTCWNHPEQVHKHPAYLVAPCIDVGKDLLIFIEGKLRK